MERVRGVTETRDAIVWAPMAPSTGTATIVVTDLAGSTALRSQLGEEAADGLRRDHDAALPDVVVAFRGRVVEGCG